MNREQADELATEILGRVFDDCGPKPDGTIRGLHKAVAQIISDAAKVGPEVEEPELLPCPCCGDKAEFEECGGEWLVRCVKCDLNTVPRTKAETAAQWNQRA